MNVLNICSDDELMSDGDDALEEGMFASVVSVLTQLFCLEGRFTLPGTTVEQDYDMLIKDYYCHNTENCDNWKLVANRVVDILLMVQVIHVSLIFKAVYFLVLNHVSEMLRYKCASPYLRGKLPTDVSVLCKFRGHCAARSIEQ